MPIATSLYSLTLVCTQCTTSLHLKDFTPRTSVLFKSVIVTYFCTCDLQCLRPFSGFLRLVPCLVVLWSPSLVPVPICSSIHPYLLFTSSPPLVSRSFYDNKCLPIMMFRINILKKSLKVTNKTGMQRTFYNTGTRVCEPG